jgi:hypothetical protein
MEKWLEDAKKIAKSEAEDFIENMNYLADSKNLDREWFIEEVVKNIHKLKGDKS